MSKLFEVEYFVGDINKCKMYIYMIISYFIIVTIIYCLLVLIAEMVYFIKCKVCNEKFDYKVVIHILTDF